MKNNKEKKVVMGHKPGMENQAKTVSAEWIAQAADIKL